MKRHHVSRIAPKDRIDGVGARDDEWSYFGPRDLCLLAETSGMRRYVFAGFVHFGQGGVEGSRVVIGGIVRSLPP